MRRVYARLPVVHPTSDSKHIGVIGCGSFAFSNIAYYLQKNFGHVLRGCMDVNLNRAASLFQRYKLDYYTDDSDEIIGDKGIDLIYIASNHASHAEYAVRALAAGKCVHIEKPHAVTDEQLLRLCDAMACSRGRVTIGLNRPYSQIGKEIKRVLEAERGSGVFNFSVVGHKIPPDHWYFNSGEGGRVLGNLCHWTDFLLFLLPEGERLPLKIVPACNSDDSLIVSYQFPNDFAATISFSTKGYSFEGVRELFTAHRGDTLLSMRDFKTLTVERLDKKRAVNLRYRDHGHEETVRASYRMVRGENPGVSLEHVWESGVLALQTKKALESGVPQLVEPLCPYAHRMKS